MRFDIYFTDKTSFEKGWTELEMLASQLMGDMKLIKGTSGVVSGVTGEFAVVELEELDDTIALMKTLKEMANKDIHWCLNADWWANADKED